MITLHSIMDLLFIFSNYFYIENILEISNWGGIVFAKTWVFGLIYDIFYSVIEYTSEVFNIVIIKLSQFYT